MQISELSSLNAQVLWASFFLATLFGAIAQKTHFCTMGAISDVVNMGDWSRMRQWGLSLGVAMIGFASLAYAGIIDPTKSLYASTRWLWLSAWVGGILFGFGMVLASGCGSKTLVRIGSGNLKSLVVLIVMAVAAFATLKGIAAVVRVATVDPVALEFNAGTTLPQMIAGSASQALALAFGLGLGLALIVWALAGKDFFSLDNLLAGFGMGAVIVAMWWVSGSLGHIAEHPETLQESFLATNSGRMEALSFVAPVAYLLDWLLFFSDKSKVLTLGIVSVAGVAFGAFVQAIGSKTFRWEGFGGTEDLANHLVGGTLMGIGGVCAMGCTIGQGLSGISTLSATSFVAVAAIVLGAVAALKYQIWRVDASFKTSF